MEYPPLIKQAYQNSRPFTLLDEATQFDEQRFNVRPTYICGYRPGKYQLQRATMLALHGSMVAENGIRSTAAVCFVFNTMTSKFRLTWYRWRLKFREDL